jgi:TIR domain
VHLAQLQNQGLLELFDDSKINPGARWREEIAAALDQAKVAILLVSADFIASKFIAENELPPLLQKAERGGATIIPVIVSPCGFHREEKLSRYQSVNSPSKSLESLSYSESEEVLTRLTEAVEGALMDVAGKVQQQKLDSPTTNEAPAKLRTQSKAAQELQRMHFSERERPEVELRILPKHLPNCEFEGRPTLHPVPV